MTAQRWTGKEIADKITEAGRRAADALAQRGVTPTLGIIRIGERDDDAAYERGATKRCAAMGVAVKPYRLPAGADADTLTDVIDAAGADDGVHGILLLRPLPPGLNEDAIRGAMPPKKDVDGFTSGAMARVYAGRGDGYPPCTAAACVEMLAHYGEDVTGRNVVVVGASLVIGRPVALLLLNASATVTVCRSKARNLPETTRAADIVIVAAGRPEFFGKEYFRAGQVVIDVGIHNRADGSLCGDVRAAEAEPLVRALTPVPGGVGSVTTAILARNVIRAAGGDMTISEI